MAHTDHHLRGQSRRRGEGERVRGVLHRRARRWHSLPSPRDEIAEQLRDDSPVRPVVERVMPRKRQATVQVITTRRLRTVPTPTRDRRVDLTLPDVHIDYDVVALTRPGNSAVNAGDHAPSILHMARERQARLAS